MYSTLKLPLYRAIKLIKRFNHKLSAMSANKYEEAVNCINSLQSNAAYIRSINENQMKHDPTYSTTLGQTQKYLKRSGLTLEGLDKLQVIHVSGTKGKGSTCAYCESILRHHGYKTGLYTSPHLVMIRERIKINGKPVSEELFSDNVIRIYNKLMAQRENESDMPLYFRFLTILAFHIFLQENVDVAIIEVGIGGEFDCTNILCKTQVVGITSLGMDHVHMLGDTIEKIAWQKAGIMKPQAQAFTVPQVLPALTVIHRRAFEKQCSIKLCPTFDEYNWGSNEYPMLGLHGDDVQKINAALAIQLSHAWMNKHGKNNNMVNLDNLTVPKLTKIGLKNCKWPGRFQILKHDNLTMFLDGAHTDESLEKCLQWFRNNSNSDIKILIFNITGRRNAEKLLEILNNVHFSHVMFVPNVAYNYRIVKDQEDILNNTSAQINRCEQHKKIWSKLKAREDRSQKISVFASVSEAMDNIPGDIEADVLVTGSLHLVGAALTVLDPNLKTF